MLDELDHALSTAPKSCIGDVDVEAKTAAQAIDNGLVHANRGVNALDQLHTVVQEELLAVAGIGRRVKVPLDLHELLGRTLTHNVVEEVHALKDLVVPVDLATKICIQNGKVDFRSLANDDKKGVVRPLAITTGRATLIEIDTNSLLAAIDGTSGPELISSVL